MQTAISYDPSEMALGQIADEGIRFVRSLIVSDDDDAPAGINMGSAVFYKAADDTNQRGRGAQAGDAVADLVFLGVCARDASRAHGYPDTYPTSSDFDFVKGEAFPCIRLGRVVVYSETGVDPSQQVYVRVVATGDEVAGRFRIAPDGTDCMNVQGARWVSTTSGAGPAELELWGPQEASLYAQMAVAMALAATTAGDILYATGLGTFTRLPIGTAGQVLKVNAGATAPEWGTDNT